MLLHDNGLTGIIMSGSNRLKDHNVFFGQNIIISAIYKDQELDFVYKNGDCVLALSMEKKDGKFSLNSLGYMVELDYERVFRLRFKNNVLVQKLALTSE